MNHKILVTYASRAGSTAEIAQVIGQVLSESGAQVDVLAMQAVTDLAPYQAVVAGSALQKFKWLPEAAAFVRTHREALAQKSFAMFTVGISIAVSDTEKSRSAASKWVAPVRALVNPLSEAFFAGLMDLSKLPRNPETAVLDKLVRLGIFPKDDRRDWNAIRAWAAELKSVLAVK